MDKQHPSQYLYIGMDIHKDNHTAVATDCFNQTFFELEIANQIPDFKKLISKVETLTKAKGLIPVFALEDSYGNGEYLAHYLASQGFLVKEVNPVLVCRERGLMTHPEKSDLQDAKGVVRASIREGIDRLPSYSITNVREIAKDLSCLVSDRNFAVKEQTRLKNQLHYLLNRSYCSHYQEFFQNPFTKKALRFWTDFPSLSVFKSSKKRVNKPNWIKSISPQDLSIISEVEAKQIRRKAQRLLVLQAEIKELDQEIRHIYFKTGQQLHTLPGCGLNIASRILAEIKDINRFPSANQLAKYAGLTPRANESGKRKRKIKDPRGNRKLNHAFYKIVLSQLGRAGTPEAKTFIKRKLAEGKSKRQAIRSLKRHLCNIIYSMVKEQRAYYQTN